MHKVAPLVVTAYYEFASKYGANKYMEWAERFLRTMNCQLLVFVGSEDVKTRLSSFCSWPERVEFRVVPISEWRAMQAPLGPEFWKRQLEIDPERAVHKSPELGAVWYEKMWFVQRAAKETNFPHDSLIWCDIGILRSRKEQRLAYLFGLNSKPILDSKLHILQVGKQFDWEVAYPWIPTSGSDISVGGGILGGTLDAWQAASAAYDEMMNKLSSAGHCVFKDQVVWTNTILANKFFFTIETTNSLGDPWMSLLYAWSIPPDGKLCFLLNLDERRDKLVEIKAETQKLAKTFTLLRFPAIRHDEPVPNYVFHNGCTKSHFEILKLRQTALVLEDDAIVSAELASVDWDMIYRNAPNFDLINLGPSTIQGWHGQSDAALASVHWSLDWLQTRISSTSHAVLYTTRCSSWLPRMMQEANGKKLTSPSSCIDYLFGGGRVCADLQQLVPKHKCLSRQRVGKSDIAFRTTDYNQYFDIVDLQLSNYFSSTPWVTLQTLQIVLQGGLGNQLFQVAAGLFLANQTGRVLSFIKNTLNPHSKTDYFESIFAKLQTRDRIRDAVEIRESKAMNTRDSLLKVLQAVKAQNVVLVGYFQIANLAQFIGNNLNLPSSDPLPFAFLHIRGGDYLRLPLHHNFAASVKYYKKAVRLFSKRKFIVYTDDFFYAEKLLDAVGLSKSEYFYAPKLGEMETFAQLAACKYGGVCANSTFSWWASYFNSSSEAVFTFPAQWWFGPVDIDIVELLSRPNAVVL